MSRKRPIIVAGPTGVGKSAFAVELAHRLDGEILGADAYQVYAGLEILTAQPLLPGSVPHHLIGFLPPSQPFNAGTFATLVGDLLPAVHSRGRVPILVGGSGLYLKAVTHGLADVPDPDPVLRAELESLPPETVLARLDASDPTARNFIDVRNPRRVLRTLEIHLLTGRPTAELRQSWTHRDAPAFRGLLLTRDRADLESRITANVEAMFIRGVVDEVRLLDEDAIGPTARCAIGLRDIQALLRGEKAEAECRASLIQATRRYAKRQLTWFRNQFNFPVIDLTLQRPHEALASALELLGEA